ncbi:MAG: hypothetical protein FWC50_14920 [Planctomycetaceae bacterium]|nr:hypothetical protein [Planctomycetaceae bacterium]
MNAVNPATKKRERILMIVCGILAVVFSIPLLMYLFGSSMSNLQRQKEELAKAVDDLDMKTLTMSRDQKNLEAKSKFSLPNNEEKAILDYKNRLSELTAQSGFEGCRIEYNRTRVEKAINVRTPGVPQNAQNALPDYYRSYQFNVTGKVTLENFGTFLQRFYQDETLQLIRSVTIKPIENARRVDVTVTIEALSLPQTKNTSLVAGQKEGDQTASKEMVQTVAKRNLFATYQPPRPDGNDRQSQPPTIDAAKHTYLEGITWVNDVPQAWFNFRLEDRKVKLRQGDKFKVGKVDCEIHSISDRQVEIRIATKSENETTYSYYSLRLGDSFFDAEWLRDE